jgi:two-component system, OmpR family, sensor histidine kinase QseC
VAAATSSRAEPRWQALFGRPGSLKLRALRDIALLACLSWLTLTVCLLALVREEGDRLFDDSLSELAEVALSFSQHELAELQTTDRPTIAEEEEISHDATLLYQVWQADGKLAFRSRLAPDSRLISVGDGFRDIDVHGATFRAYSAWNSDRSFQVQMARAPEQRLTYAVRSSALVGSTMALALVVFLLLLGYRLRRTFAVLDATAAALASRSPSNLHPVQVDAGLAELAPVISTFNELMVRVQRALLNEQRFTSDAAHELKTPLAGLKIQLRNAERAATEHERLQALQAMHQVVDRSSALVDQMLALARYDRDPDAFDLTQPVDMQKVCSDILQAHQPLADSRRIRLQLTCPHALPMVRGNSQALAVLVRNLLDNALRHAPDEGHVDLVLAGQADGVLVEVHDDGPGVPDRLSARVFDRFVRAAPPGMPGSGLGLAIAERITHLHGGSIRLQKSQRWGGALAVVHLPVLRPAGAIDAVDQMPRPSAGSND